MRTPEDFIMILMFVLFALAPTWWVGAVALVTLVVAYYSSERRKHEQV